MKWVVSGKWKIDGKAGSVTVDAKDMRSAMASAGEQGLDAIEAVNVGGTSAAQAAFLAGGAVARPVVTETKATMKSIRMGLLVGWLVCLVGAMAIPPLGYLFGLLFVLWVVVGFAGMFVK